MGNPFLEMENHVICKLKQDCGDNFTKKLEQMQKDIHTSQEIAPQFAEQVDTAPLVLAPVILNKAVWPEYGGSESMVTPIELQTHVHSLKTW